MSELLDPEKLAGWLMELDSGVRLKLHRAEQRALVSEIIEKRAKVAELETSLRTTREQTRALNETLLLQSGRGTRSGPLPSPEGVRYQGGVVVEWSDEAWGELTLDRLCDWGGCGKRAAVGRYDGTLHGYLACCGDCAALP